MLGWCWAVRLFRRTSTLPSPSLSRFQPSRFSTHAHCIFLDFPFCVPASFDLYLSFAYCLRLFSSPSISLELALFDQQLIFEVLTCNPANQPLGSCLPRISQPSQTRVYSHGTFVNGFLTSTAFRDSRFELRQLCAI